MRRKCRSVTGLIGLLLTGVAHAQSLPAFPGAEGFGAVASGGRGGTVLYVTTLAPDPNGVEPGSLNWALRQPGPRYILFKVSGVIHAPARVVTGNVTIAGQTSPGGVVVRGLVCDGHYDRNDCSNLIVRHLRSRPAGHRGIPAGGDALDDALRLDGLRRFIIDSSSFAHAEDEAVQLSWASQGTIQHSIIAETVGDHAEYGGMLMNYSHPDFPQDQLSLHHNLWYRIAGRLPEFTCEGSNYEGLPATNSDCLAHPLRLEISHNLYFDPGFLIYYNRDIDLNPAAGPYRLQLNMIGNRMIVRSGHGYPLFLRDILDVAQNEVFVADNRMSNYPLFADYQLAFCCNNFPENAPNTDFGVATRRSERHAFPPISATPSDALPALIQSRVGAAPRDPMDRRMLARVAGGVPQALDYRVPEQEDAFALDFDPANPPASPQDSDSDGMPDAFEREHAARGLDPMVADHNGTQLSLPLTGMAGYTNLEVYLNLLADQLSGTPAPRIFGDGFEPVPSNR